MPYKLKGLNEIAMGRYLQIVKPIDNGFNCHYFGPNLHDMNLHFRHQPIPRFISVAAIFLLMVVVASGCRRDFKVIPEGYYEGDAIVYWINEFYGPTKVRMTLEDGEYTIMQSCGVGCPSDSVEQDPNFYSYGSYIASEDSITFQRQAGLGIIMMPPLHNWMPHGWEMKGRTLILHAGQPPSFDLTTILYLQTRY